MNSSFFRSSCWAPVPCWQSCLGSSLMWKGPHQAARNPCTAAPYPQAWQTSAGLHMPLLGFGPDFRSHQVLNIGPLHSQVWMEDYHQTQCLCTRILEPDPVVNSGYLEESRAALWLTSLNRSTRHLLLSLALFASQHNLLYTHFSALEHLIPGFARSTDSLALRARSSLDSPALTTRPRPGSTFHLRNTNGVMPATLCNACTTPPSLHSTTLVDWLALLTSDPQTHSTLDLPAPTNSRLDHFYSRVPFRIPRGSCMLRCTTPRPRPPLASACVWLTPLASTHDRLPTAK